MHGLILNIYLPTVSANKPTECITWGHCIFDWFQAKEFYIFFWLRFEVNTKKKNQFCSAWLPSMKRQLFRDAGLRGTVLYQYQLKECLCSILIQGHWIVEHTQMLVSIINKVLSLGCTSEEKITLDCSLPLSLPESCLFYFPRHLSSQLSLWLIELLNQLFAHSSNNIVCGVH